DFDLKISDNGQGFTPDAVSGKGNGLGNMAHRMAQLGGKMEIESKPLEGTTIRIRLPLSGKS
ncbi:MAG TPA: hypothetical protein PKY12_02135, partial [Catalimonadaceae bacterium]|nr:hypothetical protein [Catalimonadaceae bacterium]